MFSYNKHKDLAHQPPVSGILCEHFPELLISVSGQYSYKCVKYLNLEKKQNFLTEIFYECSCFGMTV